MAYSLRQTTYSTSHKDRTHKKESELDEDEYVLPIEAHKSKDKLFQNKNDLEGEYVEIKRSYNPNALPRRHKSEKGDQKESTDDYIEMNRSYNPYAIPRRHKSEKGEKKDLRNDEENCPKRSKSINYPLCKSGEFQTERTFQNGGPDEIMEIVKNTKTVTLRRKDPEKEYSPCDGEIDLEVYCLEDENKLKVVVELATFNQDEIRPLPVRILLLVDVSGSMGIKYGAKKKQSKLNRMKQFAVSLMDSLDDRDQASLVTFGEEANVLMPLKEITSETREQLKTEIKQLDKCYLSTKTNLSAGLDAALKVFQHASSSVNDLLEYRNAIIVFSDGEINAGIQEPGKLVHDVREKIRSMSFGLDDSQNQWVTISVIATGNDVSETMYLLSKICSSEAFYHLDMDSSKTDFDMYLPVLMRKTAVVWNVSVLAETLSGATLINEECTQDCKIRLRSTVKGMDRTKKAFFFYDMQASSKKHIGLTINMDNVSHDPSAEIARIRVSYTSFSGKRRNTTRTIRKEDLQMNDEKKKQKIIEKNMMMDAKTVSVIALQNAADNVKLGNIEGSRADLEGGESEVQKLCNKYGTMASTSEDVKQNINLYATSLMKNMENLLKAVQGISGDDDTENNRQWARMKTVSSAIAREVPTVSETVSDSDLLCPLPAIRDVTSPQTRQQLSNIYVQRGVRDSAFIEKLNNTIAKGMQEKQVTMTFESEDSDSD